VAPAKSPPAPHPADLADLGAVARNPSVDSALAAVRELLGMEVSYTASITETHQVLEAVNGDVGVFPLGVGAQLPREMTYCSQVLSGRLPNIIPDVRADARTASMPITQAMNVGAFASVPLRFSDGRLYGTMCAASHEAQADLGYRELQFLHVFARLIVDQLERTELQAAAHTLELQAASSQALIAAVAARDSYTAAHSESVLHHAVAVAHQLGLAPDEVGDVKNVALLHDIGKISIPDAILSKPGRLDAGEWDVMRQHPVISEQLIHAAPGLSHLGSAVRAEHERWDGGGYPDHLRGEAIPLASRIVLVCDAFDAMTSDRPYRRALTQAQALAEIEAGIGTQFCPTAAGALLAALDSR
jgi:HD-GYP domain-containing protein (c-di-GMP phosphodiesterase class II)